MVTTLVTLLLFAWMARTGRGTQAAGFGEQVKSRLASSATYVAAKLGLAFAGTVTGTVYQDYNGNGAFDTTATIANNSNGTIAVAIDRGISAVTVNAYNDANAIIATTTTCGTTATGVCTGSNPGFYSLIVPNGTNLVRLEFVNLPAGFVSSAQGTGSQSSVRFVDTTAGNVANVNFAISVPLEYAQNNPLLTTTCYAVGAQNGARAADTVVLSFPYSSGSDSTGTTSDTYAIPGTHDVNIQAQAAGTAWAVAYARQARRIFVGSYFKKFAGFGPGADGIFNNTDDPGGVYVINRDTNAVVSTFNIPGATTNAHNTADYGRDNGDTGWDAVGKTSLGGLDLAEDESRLYVMSLQNRTLYALNPSTGAVLTTQAVPTANVPLPIGNCAASDVRPFAVKYHKGQLYVGMICSAESTTTVDTGWTDTNGNGRYNTGEPFTDNDGNGIYNTKDASKLRAYVYKVNPTTLAFDAAPTFQMALNYPRGVPEPSNSGYHAEWLPWKNAFPTNMAGVYAHPQPLFTDIEFDAAGNMLLGIRDRCGDQGGRDSLDNPANNTLYGVRAAGDMLIACGNPTSGWTLEANGRCGGIGSAPQNTGQGPGNGEFFFGDSFSNPSNNGNYHDEILLSGLTQIAGFPHVVSTSYDPIPRTWVDEAFTAGTRWLSMTTGDVNKAYRVYPANATGTFGKASGLGDLEPMIDTAPLEIGNRVWMDTDADGVQDPSEAALANVTVRLYRTSDNALLATALTDASGMYVFSNDPRGYAATGNSAPTNTGSNGGFTQDNQGGRASTASRRYGILGLVPGGSYQLRFDNATNYTTGNPLFGKIVTVRDVSANAEDLHDSDLRLPTPGQAIGTGNFPFITVDLTGVAIGNNNHTFDAGFTNCSTITVLPTTLPNGTIGVPYSQTLTASGGIGPYTFAVTTGTLPPGLTLSSAGVISGTPSTTGSSTFTVTVTDSNACTGTINLTIVRGCPTITVNPATLPNGTVGTAYSQTLSATGGSGSYTFSVTGTLPAGLTLSAAGVLSGTPTSTTSRTFTVNVLDSLGCTGSRSFTIQPVCNTLTITTTLPNPAIGVPYSQTLAVTGATGAVTWSVVAGGSLPAGLTLSGNTISGTATSATAASFTLRVVDANGCAMTQAFTLTPSCAAITVNPATLTTLTVGTAFTQTFTQTGGNGTITWSVSSGTLPAGLTLVGATLSGTPTSNASATFTIRATDAFGCVGSRSYTVTPSCPAITVNPTTLPNGTVGAAYNATLTASGGSTPITFAVTTGSLPAGLTMTTAGVISGTPTSSASVTFTITATAASGCTGTRTFTVTPACNTLSVTPGTLPAGAVGTAYSQTLNVTGNSGAVTWSVFSGTLPAGLTLAPATGVISGTPTAPTTANVVIRATDANGCTGSVSLAITINCNTLTVNPATLNAMTVGTAFTQSLTATGATGAVTWTVLSGTLPAGLTLSPTGVLSGTPTSSAPTTFTVEATDANGCKGTRLYNVTPGCTTITVNPAALANGTVGTAYSQTLSATGGSGAYTFAVTAGTLPAGLILNGTTGSITGTPTTAGAPTFTIEATNVASGCKGTRSFTVRICDVIVVTQTSLPQATLGVAYSQTLTATGGIGPYTYGLTGSLPAGLTLTTGGLISGTPTALGTSNFSITVSDSSSCPGVRALTITVGCAAITINQTSLPNGTTSAAYSQQLTATGGTAPLTWTVDSGALPAGLTMTPGGLISGTPTANGNYSFVIRVTDTNGCTATMSLAIAVGCATITVNPATLPNGTVGTPYSQTVSATGGTGTYTFSVSAGTLPAGLTLTGSTISGTPTSSATATFTIRATDGNGCQGTRSFTVTPACPTITVNPASLPTGTIGVLYSQTLSATGGTGPYTFALTTGTLPAGLTFSGATIGGTPTAATSATLTFTATDANGCQGSRTLTLTINCPTITVNPATLPNGTVGSAYSQTLSATGGTGTYSFGVSVGTLPAGLTLTGNTISGTPTSTISRTFTITATDANGCVGTRSFTVTPGCNTLTMTPAILPDPVVGQAYSQQLSVTGATGTVTWAVSSGALPTGITLNATGLLSGTTTSSATATFSIIATDANGCAVTVPYEIVPGCATITVNPTSLPNGTVGTAYTQTLSATGGSGTYTFSVSVGTLPAGLTLTGATGVYTIGGTPTSSAARTFTITATDGNGCTGTRQFTVTPGCNTLTVNPATLPNGTVGTAYSQTLSVAGATGAVTYSVSAGTLPAGLTLTGATISGTPTSTSAATFTILATDANGCSGTRAFTVTPGCNTLTISPSSLPNATLGAPYSQTLTVTGATGSAAWSVSVGTLPAGLTLNGATGVISGTPTANGTSNFTVRVADANGCFATLPLTIVVSCATITVNPATLPNPTVGTAYSQAITASGGSGSYTFSSTGTLPAGLTLSTGGLLSGTPTSTTARTFTVIATDTNGCTGSLSFTMTPGCNTLIVSPSSLPNGTVGAAYSQTLTITGATGAVTWAITGGTLPAGMTFNTTTGVIGGTPTAPTAVPASVTFRATDANGCQGSVTLLISVVCNTLTVNPASLPNPTAGVPYSQTLTVTGATGAVTWTTSGTLPAGITLSGTGVLSGTTNATTPSTFTVIATDANGCNGSRSFTLTPGCSTITMTPSSLPAGTVGTAYSQTLGASGGVTPYTFTVQNGTLPAGLTLAAGGLLSGTPTATASSTITFRVTDNAGCTTTLDLALVINCQTITVNPATLPNATVGAPYNQTITATGGSGTVTYTVSAGALPTGLTLTTGGVLSGTPSSSAPATFTIKATDANGCMGTRSFTITSSCTVITVTPATLPNGTVGTAYSQTLGATGGTALYSFAVSAGSLPAGLTLTGATISGTPTSTAAATFTIRATDANGCSGTLAFTVTPGCSTLTISPSTLPNPIVGNLYNQTLTVSGATGAITWSSVGTLPAGLSLSPAGVISGTPTSTVSATFTVRATDANGCVGALEFTLTPGCNTLTLTPASLPAITVGSPYTVTFNTTGATGAVTYTVSAGALPAGLTLTGATLSGTPTSSAPATFTIRAQDVNGCSATANYTLTPGCTAITVNPASLPDGSVGAAYSQTLTATGAVGTITWSVSGGALPAGITLNSTSGLVSGTPTVAGNYSFSITATASGCTGSRTFNIKICDTLTVNPATLPNATLGAAYSQTLSVSGGTGPYTFNITGGALPAGMTLTGATISGTPTALGTANFTVTVTDGLGCVGVRVMSIVVGCNTVTINQTSLPSGTVGVLYNQTLTATGGNGALTWTVTGSLPAGLTLSSAGVISGTPTINGSATFTARVADANGCQGSVTLTISIGCPTVTVNPTTLPNATVGAAYSQTLSATGGASPYTFAVLSGTLPAGLTLTGATISGTPTAASSSTFTIEATDANGCKGTRSFTVVATCAAITVTPAVLPTATVGTAYSQQLTANGANGAVTWTVTGTMPAGLALSTGGLISGTPTAPGSPSLTFRATDVNGCQGSATLTLNVICNTITVNPASLPALTVGSPYSTTLTQTGISGSVAWSVSAGTLPAGLTLNPTSGVLSGTPTSNAAASFTIRATGPNGCFGERPYNTNPTCPTITFTTTSLPSATLGVLYNQTLGATGGVTPYTFALTTGTMPAGLSLTGNIVSGTPTALANSTLTFTVTDANGCTGTTTLTLNVVCQTITINPASLPGGTIGQPYSQQLTATNANGALTWAVAVGTLPSGMTLSAGGLLSGTTPNAPFSFTVRVTDANGCQAQLPYTVTPACAVLTIAPTTLPSATIGQPYNQTLTVTGGAATPVTWTLSNGTLPAGLTLSTGGVISGTPTAAATASFTVRVTDANGCFATRDFSLVPGCGTLTIAPTTLPSATVGTAYSQTITVTGATGAVTWSVSAGTLPAGLTFSPAGVLSGTPTSTATASFTVKATDAGGCMATRDLTLTPACNTLTVNPATLPNPAVGTPYNQTLTVTGATGAVTWALQSGALPAGLTLTGATISGTPTSTAPATFVVKVTDANGCMATRTFTLTPGCGTLSIVQTTLPNGTVGTPYNQTLTVTGATGVVAWSVSTGSLPAGLTLNAGSGVISGTPTSTASATFTLRVVDANGCPATQGFTITPGCNTLTIAPTTLPAAVVGTPYSQTLTVTGATGATTWTVSTGTLPAGLTLSAAGVLSGTPTAVSSASFTLKVTDANGCMATQLFTLMPNCNALTVNPATLPNGTVGTAYTQTLTTTGATGAVTFSVSAGTLPAGLVLTGATISGTPTSTATAIFTIKATDANGCMGTRDFTVTPACNTLTINPATLPNPTVGALYNQTLTVTGATGSPNFTVSTGALPAGLTLSAAGVISGTPTSSVAATFTIAVTDANGCGGTRSFTLTPGCNTLTINPATLPNGTVGTAYNQTLTTTGATGAVSYSVSTGSLPAGLSMTAAGVISGTPTSSASAPFTIKVTDANGCMGTRDFTLTPGCNTLTVNPATLPSASVGTPYNQTLTVTGATGAVTWTISAGTLPTGLTLTGATISGTPTSVTTATFTVKVTDANGCMATREFSLAPGCNALTVNPATLPNGTVGQAYSQALTVTGATGAVTWAVSTGALPAGLTLSAGGVISGTPTSTASASFTIRATDANGCIGTRDFTITPGCNALTMTTTTLPNGTVGAAYNQTLTVTGATGTVTFTVSAGSLPAGLTMSAAGVISGTPTSTAAANFTVKATDANGCMVTNTFTVTPGCNTLTMSPTTLPNGAVGAAYSQTLSVTGATGAVTFTVSVGSLPAGLTMSAAGVISGTPTSSAATTFTIKATDANSCMVTKQFTVTPGCNTLTVNPATLPNAAVGAPYSATLTATGETGAVTFSVSAGSLPAGLSLTGATIGGTPTSSATANFTIKVTDANGCMGTRDFTITPGCNTLTINPASLPAAAVGVAYSQTLTVTGATGAVTYSLLSGSLPAGLTLTGATIAGTPTSTANAAFTIKVTDANSCMGTRDFTITPGCNTLTVNPATLPNPAVGVVYNQTLTVTGATGAVTWSVVGGGSLPAGLTLTTAGVLSGTPTSTSAATFTVRVIDANGCSATRDFTLTPGCNTLTINPTTLPNGTVGAAYSQTLTVTGATGTTTWSLNSGTLPAGITLSAAGVLSGTPTSTASATFTVKVTDANGCMATATFTVTPGCNTLTVNPTSLPAASVGIPYNQTLTVAGATGAVTWSVSAGTLPAGLSLSAAGVISGTPTAVATAIFTVKVTDANGCMATRDFSLMPNCNALTVNPATLPNGTVGTPYSQSLTVTGATGAVTWSVSGGALPAGLTLTGNTIGGTPTSTASATFTIKATDANGCIGTRDFTITPGCNTLTLNPPTLPNAVVGAVYNVTLSTAGSAGTVSYTVSAGTLPAGLTLNGATISGTPTSTAARTFTIKATDANGCMGTREFTITPGCNTYTLAPGILPNGTVGTPYTATLSAVGASGTVTFALNTGSLPAGLSLSATGVISGTPTSTASATFTIKATDANGCMNTTEFTITPGCNTLTVNPTSLPAASVGVLYNQTLTVTGATGAVTWATAGGGLPAGLTLSTAGVISGTPTAVATATFTVKVTDANGCMATREFSLMPGCNALTVNPATLPNGTVGAAYSQTMTVTGATGAVTWSVSTGTLPAGLTLSAAGVLSGTPTSTASATFTIKATDANGCIGTRDFVITPGCNTLTINQATLPNGTVGAPYSATLTVTGATGAVTWSVAGTLPTGLTLSAAGVLSGTPTSTTPRTVTIKVTDANGCMATRDFTITPGCNTLTIAPSTLPNGTVGTAYNQSLSTTGATGAVTYAITAGSLPAGLNMSTAGVISGTPMSTTSAPVTIKATDANGCMATASFTVTPGCNTLTVNPATLPSASVGTPYNQTLSVTGATGATTWTFTGTLPSGLSLSAAGVISGTPTSVTTATFTVKVTDANGCMATREFSLMPGCNTLTINPATLPNGVIGQAYNQTLSVTGNNGTVTWAVSAGNLPAGIGFNTQTGQLTGVPTATTTANFTIKATDANGCIGTRDFTVTPGCNTLAINPATLPNATVGTLYTQTLTVTGAAGATTWTVSGGSLPTGLTLSATGVLSGTPTSTAARTFTVKVTDANGCMGTRDFTMTPGCNVLTVNPATLPNGTVGTVYSQNLTVTGATGAVTWTSTGTLPAGLTLTAAGVLSGTPTSTTSRTFTVNVTDANGCSGSREFTITPGCNTLTIAPTTLPGTTVGTVYNQTFSVTGATGTLTWTVSAGTLPAGLTLNATTGVLSGTPTSSTAASFTIKVTDANGCMATQPFTVMPACNTLTINPATLPNGTVGTAYSQTLSTTGSNGTLTWAVSTGSLPAGLTLSPSTGVISGTPTSTTSATFTIGVTDGNGCTGTRQFTVTPVCGILTVNPATLPNGTVGAAYSQTLTVTGATGATTWAISAGTLPAGLTLSGATISGTPTSTTVRTFTVKVTDANGCMATREFTITPACNVLTIAQTSLATPYVGLPYNQTLTVTGATGTVNWTVSAGALPTGLQLNATTGVISGTPTSAASATFTVKVTDANGCMATQVFTVVTAPVFSIGNRVFKDLNDDGLLGSGETGVNGVTVRLLTASGALAKDATGADVAAVTTASGGYYRFDNLAAGDYVVEVAAANFATGGALAGCTSSTKDAGDPDTDVDDNDDNGIGTAPNANNGIRSAVLTLGPAAGSEPTNETDRGPGDPAEPNGNTNLTIDFGFTTTMSLGNAVWKDQNNNGLRDSGEAGIDGVKLDLYLDRDNSGTFTSADSPAIANTVTANGGAYLFTGLTPGKYIVNVTNLNFRTGGVLLGCLSSTVTDLNPDNDEDNDDNGSDDADPATNGSASRVITLTGFGEPTTDGDGNNGNLTLDFGFYTPVNLGNMIWKDLNNDGLKGSGEAGLDGVIVELLRDADNSGALNGSELTTVIQTRTTAGGGLYQFTTLQPGNYVVRVAASNFAGNGALVGCVSSTPTDATPNNDEDNDDNGIDSATPATTGILSGVITLGAGAEPPATVDGDDTNSNATLDFGFFTPVNLGNFVWKDLNNDGLRQSGEPGVNGVKVELFRDANNNNQLDAGDGALLTMATTVNGAYSFTNLSPGNYFVRIAASNFVSGGALFECVSSTTTQANPNTNIDNDDNGIDNGAPQTNGIASGVITLQAGSEPPANVDGDDTSGNQTVDFGFASANQSIGNLVWKDTNRNGNRDNGEAGITGVKLNLYRDNGDGVFNASTDVLVTTTTTGAGGSYLFSGLLSASYFVQVDVSNFTASGALNGCISSNGVANPNSDTDNDDNGSDSYNPAAQPPVSGIITLTTGGEPGSTIDGDGTNGNQTIDFGFINFLNIKLDDPATCVGPGVILQLTAALTNPSNSSQPNNAGNEFEAVLPNEIVLVPNSCTASSGTCTIENSRKLVWNGSIAGNSTLTIRYRIQLANNVQAGAPYCITSTAFFDTDLNGSNETSASVDVCGQATCPQVGPGEPSENGCSVLMFPIYTSNAANPTRGNTRISITNTSPTDPATMHLFFVDGESCSVADSYLCLTPNQTTTFLMSDLDPGTTGYLVAVAVDPATGCPAYFNHLIGDEYVKFESGHYANLKAQCAQAQPGGDFSCNGNAQEATLKFDGVQYSRLPRVVSVDNLPSPADGNDTRLYLTRIGGSLSTGSDVIGGIFGLAYDDAERAYSFSSTVNTCLLRTPLNGSFPRTAPRLDAIIPSGRTGWMKLWTQADAALIGAVLNFNLNSKSQAGAYNGGHDLHALRYTESATLTIPLFPGHCQ